MPEILVGKYPIREALLARRRAVRRFFYAQEKLDPCLKEVLQLCESQRIPVKSVSRKALEDRAPGTLTQGWLAEVDDYPYRDYQELIQAFQSKDQVTVLALDQIQDPQNLGAILRTAEVGGVDAVLIPEHRSSGLGPAVCKAAAGAEEYLNISRVTNLVRTLEDFQQNGFWVVGTAPPEENAPSQEVFGFEWPAKSVLVLGAEGEGMRRLTKETCDFLIHLPLAGKISSLNVSAAGAVFLYERIRKKRI